MGSKIVRFLFCFILLFFVISPTNSIAKPNDVVRVGITDNKFQNVLKQQIVVYGTSDCEICDKYSGKVLIRVPANTDITVSNLLSGLDVLIGQNCVTLRDFVVTCPSGLLGIKDLKRKGISALYHGAFEFYQEQSRNGFYLINLVELQEYLKGVVPNEMPVRFGLEALKAQAVAARNYVLTPRTKLNPAYDVVDSVASQVYYGANTESDIATRAVMETDGIVALYNNELILTLYSSTAGGYTESYSNAFSDTLTKAFPAPNKPYLTAVPDKDSFEPLNTEEKARDFYQSKHPSYDIDSPYYRWKREWTEEELESILTQTLPAQSKTGFVNPACKNGDEIGKLKGIHVVKRGNSGKIIELDIQATKGCYRVAKELVIRRVFQKDGNSLPSANVYFDIETDVNGNITKIIAQGGGYGHGVGMSQFGAGYMAAKLHQPYYNILRHYYTGINLGTRPVEILNTEVEQTFWAPIGRAEIVIVGISTPKIKVMINGKMQEFSVARTLFKNIAKIDISSYIEDGQNKIVFYPSYIPMKVYVEVIESYANANKELSGGNQ
ncbi:MAG: SpoIID/LytB domain-containing protein [bacterium]|nr:SpoIID/LytB domain-containing protein [bacterium]